MRSGPDPEGGDAGAPARPAAIATEPEGQTRKGRFIVIEGGDAAGRSTQVRRLLPWLEELGWPAVHVGIGRSKLAERPLRDWQAAPESGVHALALLYAADLHDQVEQRITAALDAGFAVVADRWVGTVMARCSLRGANPDWLRAILPLTPEPDCTLYLQASPRVRLARAIAKRGLPSFIESGRDLGIGGDPLRSFLRYQDMLDRNQRQLGATFGGRWQSVTADDTADNVQDVLRQALAHLLVAPAVDTDG